MFRKTFSGPSLSRNVWWALIHMRKWVQEGSSTKSKLPVPKFTSWEQFFKVRTSSFLYFSSPPLPLTWTLKFTPENFSLSFLSPSFFAKNFERALFYPRILILNWIKLSLDSSILSKTNLILISLILRNTQGMVKFIEWFNEKLSSTISYVLLLYFKWPNFHLSSVHPPPVIISPDITTIFFKEIFQQRVVPLDWASTNHRASYPVSSL